MIIPSTDWQGKELIPPNFQPNIFPNFQSIAGSFSDDPDLFSFNDEVIVVLEALVGKTLEQSMMEVLEEEELAAITRQKMSFRNKSLALQHSWICSHAPEFITWCCKLDHKLTPQDFKKSVWFQKKKEILSENVKFVKCVNPILVWSPQIYISIQIQRSQSLLAA